MSDKDLMKKRRRAGQASLRFFSEIKGIKSANNPFAFLSEDQKDDFYDVQRPKMDGTIVGSFDVSATCGMGNCDEKGRICYSSLISNPTLLGNSYVSLVSAIEYDHVFVVVADIAIEGAVMFKLKDIGKTGMIVDGWTEDVYFPNISVWAAMRYGLGTTPNPRQLVVRNNIKNHKFAQYGKIYSEQYVDNSWSHEENWGVPDNF